MIPEAVTQSLIKENPLHLWLPDWAIPSDDQLDEFTKETGIEVEVSGSGLG